MVHENTAIYPLYVDEESEFFENNLKIYNAENDFFAKADGNWREHYVATITVPIRIHYRKSQNGDSNGNNSESKNNFHTIGFLCVDTQSKKIFTEKNFNTYIELIKGFADALYKCFNRFSFYSSELEEENENLKHNNKKKPL